MAIAYISGLTILWQESDSSGSVSEVLMRAIFRFSTKEELRAQLRWIFEEMIQEQEITRFISFLSATIKFWQFSFQSHF